MLPTNPSVPHYEPLLQNYTTPLHSLPTQTDPSPPQPVPQSAPLLQNPAIPTASAAIQTNTQITHSMITGANNGISKPKIFFIDYKEIEPSTTRDALKHPHWRKAMEEEYSTLMKNETWELVSSLPNQKIVDCKCVFKIKRRTDGFIACYKARLVAKGFHQTTVIDYSETFSPVVKPVTIWVLFTLALENG